MGYEPERVVLERYARLLVEFALGRGNGIQAGDVVQINGTDACKPLYVESCKAVWRAGGHVIHAYKPSEDEHDDVHDDPARRGEEPVHPVPYHPSR